MIGFIIDKIAHIRKRFGNMTLEYGTRMHKGIIKETSRIGGRSWMQNEIKVNAKSANA